MKDRIRLIMEDQHLTQQSFAQLIGISPASLSSIFKDRTKPTLNIVDAIKKSFPQVNLEWLLYGIPPMYIDKEAETSDTVNANEDGVSSGSSIKRLDFDTEEPSSPTLKASMGSLFEQPQMQGVNNTPNNMVKNEVKNIDNRQRKITEIRIFYDDQTWETFVPKQR